MNYEQARLRRLNERSSRGERDYVLYWMQASRRLERNHALDYALRCAEELGRPLVVYEGLRLDYPWASRRLHRFVLEGMTANAARAEALGLNYWAWVETARGEGRGLLSGLARRACLVVTWSPAEFPASPALARKVDVPVIAVDSSCLVPVASAAGRRRRPPPASPAQGLRRGLDAPGRAAAEGQEVARRRVRAPFDVWQEDPRGAFLEKLPLDASVPAVSATPGGAPAARRRLRRFLAKRLEGYAREPIAAPIARGGARQRAQPLPPLRPDLDRGGRAERARDHRGLEPGRAAHPQSGEARGLLQSAIAT